MRGAWVEIGCIVSTYGLIRRRSPCGERGLKCVWTFELVEGNWSLPVRGAWVEICHINGAYGLQRTSLPVRGAWVEM